MTPTPQHHREQPEPFSVLMAYYKQANPDHLRDALWSIGPAQSLKPDEIVLVRDGDATAEHDAVVDDFTKNGGTPLRHIVLPHNMGLGPALNAGLSACRNEVVARMDADDIALPNRFAIQLPIMASGIDMMGAGLLEFDTDADNPCGVRVPLTDPDRIVADARFHQTFNHPTVVYRKAAVFDAGGYQDFPSLEDYLLFSTMILNGARVANVADPLVKYRIGEGAYARRGGVNMLHAEMALQRRLRDMGFTTRSQYVRNVLIRGGYRLIPESLRKVGYRTVLARKGDRHNTD